MGHSSTHYLCQLTTAMLRFGVAEPILHSVQIAHDVIVYTITALIRLSSGEPSDPQRSKRTEPRAHSHANVDITTSRHHYQMADGPITQFRTGIWRPRETPHLSAPPNAPFRLCLLVRTVRLRFPSSRSWSRIYSRHYGWCGC